MFTKYKSVIFGIEGLELTQPERQFFRRVKPLGFILFSRNISNKEQVKALVTSLREVIDSPHAPILIDQEGGRVCRLKQPIWYQPPPAHIFGEIAKSNLSDAKRAVELNTQLICSDLMELGINVDAIPVLDVRVPSAHDVIGDRAFSDDKDIVAQLGAVVCDVCMLNGVVPIIKHIPGHGRARADSHLELPLVDVEYKVLKNVDFYPFKKLNKLGWGMTAHILYKAIDPDNPATFSKKVIFEIRNAIGFKGLIITDCITMKALSGSMGKRARNAIEAGCDLVLHSHGSIEEKKEVINNVPYITKKQATTLKTTSYAEVSLSNRPQGKSIDAEEVLDELRTLMAKYKNYSLKVKATDPTERT